MPSLTDNTKKMNDWNESMKLERARQSRAVAQQIRRKQMREAATALLRRMFSKSTSPLDTHSRVIWQHRLK